MTAFVTELDRDSNVPFTSFRFSGGEIQVRLQRPIEGQEFEIRAHLGSSDDIMEVFMLTDAIRSAAGAVEGVEIDLVVPYFPYARQDRSCEAGEAFAARVMCDLINQEEYRSVEVWDAHSRVVPSFLRRCVNRHCRDFVKRIARKDMCFVAPDNGARTKVCDCGVLIEPKWNVISGEKVRDPKDGRITSLHIDAPDIGIDDFLIIDDICDGGRTFIEVAKQLRPKTRGKVLLYVTHGIFSKGFAVFDGLIDHIYCANPFPGVSSPMLTKI